jgi:glutamate 5-kinase
LASTHFNKETQSLKTRISTNGRRTLGRIRRIVVKIGSGVIAGGGRLRPKVVADLAYDVSVLRHQGHQITMVVSGAVAAGYQPLGFDAPPTEVVDRQAAASVGQHKLMSVFAAAFARHRLPVAQLLLSADDIEHRRRFLSARHTLHTLLSRGAVPIINENDALSDDEIKVGDNDHLAALVTSVVSADLLIILSRVPGLCSDGGHGPVIPQVDIGSDIDEHISLAVSASGVGGMVAKVAAARLASRWGVPTIIADGTRQGMLQRVIGGESVGTVFVPSADRLPERKQWIAVRSRSLGVLRVDAGATEALTQRGASLLPTGVVEVQGDFRMGERVDIHDESGRAIAVGLASYAADEIRRLRGRRQSEIRSVLGYEYVKEIVNRDDLVLLQ